MVRGLEFIGLDRIDEIGKIEHVDWIDRLSAPVVAVEAYQRKSVGERLPHRFIHDVHSEEQFPLFNAH